ncbi:tetratricopeptide repeat protein [Tundrisphaera sp. TA3]|uniref:tetratricopeptide repeat protein n=1 Tax=Tundrisphaera sp. TA3 TaxID=3435775 RepID=UPI003EBB88D5
MAKNPRHPRRRPAIAAAARRGLAVATILAAIGGTGEAGPIARWLSGDPAYGQGAPKPTGNQTPSLLGRWLTGDRTPHASEVNGPSIRLGADGWESTKVAANPELDAELAAAMKVFEAGKYAEALPLLNKIANRESKKGTSPWYQQALFYAGECQFQLGKYVDANNSFETLVKKNPGLEPKYLDKVVAREYQIAQIWLAAEDPKAKPLPFTARFTGQMPMVDSDSHAVKILEQVRLHDSKGPLSDVAVLRMADHYHTIGDYESAALYYDQLVADHAKSEYRERAMRSSIDAKMKSYLGPKYDKTGLESAREMVKQAMVNYPEDVAASKDLYHTLDLINDEEAASVFEAGMYYVRAMKPTSAEYQFGMVMAKWPKSKWAAMAKKEMAAIAKAPRKASLPSKIMTLPGSTDSFTGGASSGAGTGMGGASSAGGMGASPY